jgi:alpha-N-arabinofuranosidase
LEDDLQPYIDEVLNELEYCLGDENTEYGKKRVANGRKEPFDVKYVEIGNEDFFAKHYDHRFPAYNKAINEKYPDLTIICHH